MDPSGPEWIDDPNDRLRAYADRGATHAAEAKAHADRLGWHELVWKPYAQAGKPYGDDEEGALRYYQEREALRYRPDPPRTTTAVAYIGNDPTPIPITIRDMQFVASRPLPPYFMERARALAELEMLKQEIEVITGHDGATVVAIIYELLELAKADPRPVTFSQATSAAINLLCQGVGEADLLEALRRLFLPTLEDAAEELAKRFASFVEALSADGDQWFDPLETLRRQRAIVPTLQPVPPTRLRRPTSRGPPC